MHLQYLRAAVTKLEGEIPDKLAQIQGGWSRGVPGLPCTVSSLVIGLNIVSPHASLLLRPICRRQQHTGLRELDLSCAKLCGGIPKPLDCGAKLAVLNLSHNRLSGENKSARERKRDEENGDTGKHYT